MEKHLSHEQLAAFLAGELKAEARGRVRGHLRSCQPCALAFSHAVEQSMTPELTAKFQRPMPRPPAAVLKATGIQSEHEGTVWTALQALEKEGVSWACEELERIRQAFQGLLFWGLTGMSQQTRGTRAPTLGPEDEWEQQIDVPAVDSSGQQQGRPVRFEVVQPPIVTSTGEFSLILRTREPGFAGWSLRCTVTAAEGRKVTFAGELQAEVDNWGWQAWIEAAGLPASEEPTVIPPNFVRLSLQERPQQKVL